MLKKKKNQICFMKRFYKRAADISAPLNKLNKRKEDKSSLLKKENLCQAVARYSVVEAGSENGCKRYLVRGPHASRDLMNVMRSLLELPAATADGKEQA